MRSLGESWAEVAWERARKGTWPGFFIVLRRRAWGTCVVWISFTHQRRGLVIRLSWCGHKGQRDRIVLQAVSHQRSSGIRLLIVLINPLPQNSSPRWRLAFLSLGFKANHSGDYCTGRGPTHDRGPCPFPQHDFTNSCGGGFSLLWSCSSGRASLWSSYIMQFSEVEG